jgi:CTP synthase
VQTKFIFVTGGVMSGLGKGVVTSSVAKLLQLSNQKVSCVKIDPYLNYDAGTMNPIAHGEVFVTEDGGECDMDIGNYERFLNQNLSKNHNITTAQIYSAVIEAERRGEYLGACVQIIPHVTDEIKRRLHKIADDEQLDILVVECGGTVGDIESLPFLEALRQMRLEEGSQNVLFIHVTLAPSLDVVGEQKTKPTQHSVQELRRIGIQPDLMAVRCSTPLLESTKKKISMFTNVTAKDVFSCHDAKSIFMVPQILYDQGIIDTIFTKFGKVGLVNTSANWDKWNSIVNSLEKTQGEIKIAMVGKYVTLPDSYVSVNHALKHASAKIGKSVSIDWIDSENINGNVEQLSQYHGILVPGGFGERGAEGIIATANFARTKTFHILAYVLAFSLLQLPLDVMFAT